MHWGTSPLMQPCPSIIHMRARSSMSQKVNPCQTPNLLELWSWTSQNPEWQKVNVCGFSYPACGIFVIAAAQTVMIAERLQPKLGEVGAWGIFGEQQTSWLMEPRSTCRERDLEKSWESMLGSHRRPWTPGHWMPLVLASSGGVRQECDLETVWSLVWKRGKTGA